MLKYQKQKIFLIGMCLLTILSGCLTYQGQLDTSVPMKEQVTLVIIRPLSLLSVDNNDVDTGLLGLAPASFDIISIPSGEHKLYIMYNSIATDNKYKYEISGSTTITYDFDPGYKYTIAAYTEVYGAKVGDVNTAVILNLSDGFKVAIERQEKPAGGALVAYENGYYWGLSMGPVVRIGFDVGLIPIGILLDTGKLAFGLDTTINMSAGWRPSLLEKEFGSKNKGMLSDRDGMDVAYTFGGLFSVYFNQNNGKAFGIGIGGGYTISGYTTDLYSLSVNDDRFKKFPNVKPLPQGVWYVRAAVTPKRRSRFIIYFDYYLKNLTDELPSMEDFRDPYYSRIDMDMYYDYVIHHPRSWFDWGLGISGKLF